MLCKDVLLEQLAGQVSDGEREALKGRGEGLVISRYNRETVLRMLSLEKGCRDGGDPVDADRVEGLTRGLRDYLNRYMPERPEGHKWILLSCLFLTFIVREPMHPKRIVGWEKEGERYLCPVREAREGSLCRWCVCGQGPSDGGKGNAGCEG